MEGQRATQEYLRYTPFAQWHLLLTWQLPPLSSEVNTLSITPRLQPFIYPPPLHEGLLRPRRAEPAVELSGVLHDGRHLVLVHLAARQHVQLPIERATLPRPLHLLLAVLALALGEVLVHKGGHGGLGRLFPATTAPIPATLLRLLLFLLLVLELPLYGHLLRQLLGLLARLELAVLQPATGDVFGHARVPRGEDPLLPFVLLHPYLRLLRVVVLARPLSHRKRALERWLQLCAREAQRLCGAACLHEHRRSVVGALWPCLPVVLALLLLWGRGVLHRLPRCENVRHAGHAGPLHWRGRGGGGGLSCAGPLGTSHCSHRTHCTH
mmetsp:Transcript_1334/g.3070  ORF Transcript_1334/g.3070 Transcript_1334/m.3070 type:complete len:324 (+) Transcript_1334:3267-4238(+)